MNSDDISPKGPASPDGISAEGPALPDDIPVDSAAVPEGIRPLVAALYFVATPIGAARDITLRGLDILARTDLIAAEDTRTARKLMDIHGVALRGRQVIAYHDHSGPGVRARLVAAVTAGQSVAYVSEAGTPLLADPGFALGREMIAHGLELRAAPGASALLAALAVAGQPTDRFVFAGFLPTAKAARRAEIMALKDLPMTVIFYESPKRIRDLLAILAERWGEAREAAVCRELTKRFEEVQRGTLGALADSFADRTLKGECVVVVGKPVTGEVSEAQITAALAEALKGARLKEAAAMVAEALGQPRRRVYQIGLGLGRIPAGPEVTAAEGPELQKPDPPEKES